MEEKAVFIVEGANREDFRVEIRTGEGRLIVVDEPKDLGGGGAGPNPIELFLASIASCFAITARIHASRTGVEIERIEVSARGIVDLRSVLGVEGFEPGLELIELRARIVSRSRCSELDKVIEKTVRTWVVGYTVSKSGKLRVFVDRVCKEE